MEHRTALQWIRRYLSWTLLLVLIGVLYILVFNENSYSRKIELNNQIAELQDSIKSVQDTALYYHHLNMRINTDRDAIERVAREDYHMVGNNEDVYVFDN